MKMFKPVHPGRILRDDYLDPLELTIGELANALGVSRQTVTAILNERSGISPEMSLRLAKAFDTTPDLWITMQRNYDLHAASEKFNSEKIKQLYTNPIQAM